MVNEDLSATNQCVMCGLCLEHCPTYALTRHEADSPRGRISLMQAFNLGQLPLSDSLVRHLDGCLACRACEAVCPAIVPYGRLIDTAQQFVIQRRTWRARLVSTLMTPMLSHRWLRTVLSGLVNLYQRTGLQSVVRGYILLKLPGLQRSESFIGSVKPRELPFSTNSTKYNSTEQGSVALFTGCFAEIFDRDTLASTYRVLRYLGDNVVVPVTQTCCGALHQHSGKPKKALDFFEQNIAAFDDPRITSIVSSATGCGVMLSEYGQHLCQENAVRFTQRHFDISAYLVEKNWEDRLKLKPLNEKVVVHTPCSLSHVLRQPEYPLLLLRRIPEIELFELPENNRCCGAAGTHMLRQPAAADALLQDKLDYLRNRGARILVTTNFGCRLHFEAGLRRANLNIEVVHPITLIARSLSDSGDRSEGKPD